MGIKRSRVYRWFIEPLDAHTNATLARSLPEQDAIYGARDDQGVKRNVYQVGSRQLESIRKSKGQLNLDFKIYVREGNGKMRLASFLPVPLRRKRMAAASVAQVAQATE